VQKDTGKTEMWNVINFKEDATWIQINKDKVKSRRSCRKINELSGYLRNS
jgi:hypothetical protein